MPLPGKHLKRRLEIARLLWKYGRGDIVQLMDVNEAALREEMDDTVDAGDKPERLARDLEAMGPAFIKLGQLLSTRSDLLSPPYIEALARLQDNVAPIPFADIERVVEEELGVRISKGFGSFDSNPLGSASLAQVHRATLRDDREVVVKVQRPGVRERVLDDLEVLEGMVDLVANHSELGRKFAVAEMFREFKVTMVRELDFRRELRNLKRTRVDLSEYPLLIVPEPIESYSSSRVLTMEYIKGRTVRALPPLFRLEFDGEEVATQLIKGYLDQILVHGFFSADPHPGNLLVTDDGRLGLIDLGMAAYLAPHTQQQFLQLLLAIGDGKTEAVADIVVAMGERLDDFNADGFERAMAELVLPHRDSSLTELNLGRMVMEMTRAAGEHGLRPAPEITMLGKTLLNLDEATATLAPNLDPVAVVKEHTGELMRGHLRRSISGGSLVGAALDATDFLQRLPGRLNSFADQVGSGGFEIRLKAFDEEKMMSGMQKIANRITVGLIVAALIVGAALLTTVQTDFEIFGYPGLAIVLFMLAAATGFFLVADILLTDRRRSRH